jgi:hypothetical protein
MSSFPVSVTLERAEMRVMAMRTQVPKSSVGAPSSPVVAVDTTTIPAMCHDVE